MPLASAPGRLGRNGQADTQLNPGRSHGSPINRSRSYPPFEAIFFFRTPYAGVLALVCPGDIGARSVGWRIADSRVQRRVLAGLALTGWAMSVVVQHGRAVVRGVLSEALLPQCAYVDALSAHPDSAPRILPFALLLSTGCCDPKLTHAFNSLCGTCCSPDVLCIFLSFSAIVLVVSAMSRPPTGGARGLDACCRWPRLRRGGPRRAVAFLRRT